MWFRSALAVIILLATAAEARRPGPQPTAWKYGPPPSLSAAFAVALPMPDLGAPVGYELNAGGPVLYGLGFSGAVRARVHPLQKGLQLLAGPTFHPLHYFGKLVQYIDPYVVAGVGLGFGAAPDEDGESGPSLLPMGYVGAGATLCIPVTGPLKLCARSEWRVGALGITSGNRLTELSLGLGIGIGDR